MEQQGFQSRDIATISLAFSLLALAVAIAYFAYKIGKIGEQVPEILAQVESTSNVIGPVVSEISDIRELIPPILEQVEETRKIVPPILAEVEQTRKQIPDVLKSVDNVSSAVNQTNKQLKSYRPLVPEAIKQIELTREAIDPALDRVDVLISKAEEAGRKASEGAVTGVFTGVLTAPLRIVDDIGTSVTGLTKKEANYFTEEEITLYRRKGGELLNTGKSGDKVEWKSKTSSARGELSIQKIYTKDGRNCKVIKHQAWKDDKQVVNKTLDLCKNANNEWELQNAE